MSVTFLLKLALIYSLVLQTSPLNPELQKSVILHYDFENVTSNTVFDASGNGNHASIVKNVAVTNNDTRCGQAMGFHSGFLVIHLSHSPIVDKFSRSHREMTIGVWLKLQVLRGSSQRSIFSSYYKDDITGKSQRMYQFAIRKSGKGMRCFVNTRNEPSKVQLCDSTEKDNLFEVGQWTHLTAVYSSDKKIGKVYRNGIEWKITGHNFTIETKLPYPLGHRPAIGGYNSTKPFIGDMDDFYIFNRALNETEISELVQYCPLDDKVATTTKATTTQNAPTNQSAPVTKAPPTSPDNVQPISLYEFDSTTTVLPTSKTTTLLVIEALPTNKTTTPSITEAIPTNKTTTPLITEAIPTNKTTTPLITEAIPTNKTTTPLITEAIPTNKTTTSLITEAIPTNKPTTAKVLIVVNLPKAEIAGFSSKYFKDVKNIKNVSRGKEVLKESINKITHARNSTMNTASGEKAIEMTQGLETVALILATNILKPNESISVKTESAFLEMSIPTSGFTFPSPEQKSAQNITESLNFSDSIVDSGPRAVVCMSYADLHKRLPQTTTLAGSYKPNSTVKLNSKIIGAAVSPPLEKSLNDPIEITFNHKPVDVGQQICAFWNHSLRNANGKLGQWSTSGCLLNLNKSLATKTVCECNHLTNFALLLQSSNNVVVESHFALQVITYIGCSMSVGACVLCFIMFFAIRKKDTRHYLHINLSIALAISQIILLFGIDKTEHKIFCKVMAVSLHYFYLVAFLLMLSEGVHLVMLVESAFKYGDLKIAYYLLGSWGAPAVIVGITLAVRFDSYTTQNACFISSDKGTVYAFLVPFCLIIAINTVILVVILRHVIRKTSLPLSSRSASKVAVVRATIRSMVILFPVMGFTWIFAVLFFAFKTVVLEYLFGIFCSLQGFFIFLFQYALNSENRTACMHVVWRWRTTSSSNFSHPESGRGNSKQVESFAANKLSVNAEVPKDEKCHLLVYRTIDDDRRMAREGATVTTLI